MSVVAMNFLAANRLWLLVAVAALAAAYLVMQVVRRSKYVVRFTNLALLGVVAPKRPAWRRHVPAVAFLLALAMLTVGFARPQRDERVPRDRATIMMAVDVSLSMQATDVTPTRLEAAKSAADAFVDLLPARFNVGLVAFAGTAQVLVVPTIDHDTVKRAIENLQLREGTAIGEAIFASLDAIKQVPSDPGQEPPPARIVLMSDGETTTGRPNEEAVAAAVEAKVPVSTIAFGTSSGTITYEGQRVRVPVNADALRQVAAASAGTFFEATSGEQLRKVYEDVGSSIGFVTEKHEITVWFVGLALLFALATAAASLVWFSRLP
jgi:Ca-activated chloride channel family protein